MLATEWTFAVFCITLNNKLISQRQHVPTRRNSYHNSFPRPAFPSYLRWKNLSRRTKSRPEIWDLCSKQKRAEKERQVRAGASVAFAKSHGNLARDTLVTGANKKRTDECINGGEAMHRPSSCSLGPSPPRAGAEPGGGGAARGLSQLLAGASVSEICLSSSFVLLHEMLQPDIRRRKSILLPSAGPSGISAAHRPND